jgi:hypothetical protein
VKLRWAVVLGVIPLALCACGSSHSRSYSIQQVQSAFAAHGITLRQRDRTTGAVVALDSREGVRVLVDLGVPNVSFGWTGERPIDRGNLIVFRPNAYGQAVNGALHDLR